LPDLDGPFGVSGAEGWELRVPLQRALRTLTTVWDIAVVLWRRSGSPDAGSAPAAESQLAIPLQQKSDVVLHGVGEDDAATAPTQTVRFGLDGQQYEIDLSDQNADQLRATFARYIAAGRRADRQTSAASSTRTRGRTPRTAPPTTANGHDPAAIREWARTHGHQISDRGPIPAKVRQAYAADEGVRGR
jgi:hypothetical protein